MSDQAALQFGPYSILEHLGQGGMGIVYRGRHDQSAEQVALKTVLVPREGLLQNIRREIRALARVSHPGIVKILDEGVQDGRPWYAMELLEGVTLRHYFAQPSHSGIELNSVPSTVERCSGSTNPVEATISQSWWTASIMRKNDILEETVPADLHYDTSLPASQEHDVDIQFARQTNKNISDILTFMCRLCSPLAFLHGEGIVHRDLKPDNIFVRPAGFPVIMDFGLMMQFSGRVSREELLVEEGSMGTALYMSPEQIRGDFVDPRSDLYSLGCILYELLTGFPPFWSQKVSQILESHLWRDARPPSHMVEGISSDLDHLVLRLLAKNPRHRYGYADDVAAQLTKMGALNGHDDSQPSPRPYLYRPGFIGRDEQLIDLAGNLDRIKRGQGGFVLIGGESGVGKTRLVMEIGNIAIRRNIPVQTNECFDGRKTNLEVLRNVLQHILDHCRSSGQVETDRLVGKRGKVFAVYFPEFAALPGQNNFPEPEKLPAQAARVRLFTYLTDTLEKMVEKEGALIIMDDLQWADELSFDFLDFLLQGRHVEKMPLIIVGTYRQEEVSPQLQNLIDLSGVDNIALERMKLDVIGEIIQDMLALPSIPVNFSKQLGHYSEGNPFFVAEYLRSAVQDGLLWRDDQGTWQVADKEGDAPPLGTDEFISLPKSLRELIHRRLQGITEKARTVTKKAAVIGREIDFHLLKKMTAMGEEELLDVTEELFRRQILEKTLTNTVRFVHDKIREVTYEQIDPPARRIFHHSAAVSIEAFYTTRRDEFLAELGQHWLLAGELATARDYFRAGARQAYEHFAYVQAEHLYRAYCDLVEGPTEESVTIYNEMGKMFLTQGKSEAATTAHETAIQHAQQCDDRLACANSYYALARVHDRRSDFEHARTLFEKSLSIAEKENSTTLIVEILRGIGITYMNQGNRDQSKKFLEQAKSLAHELDNQNLEGKLLNNLAYLDIEDGKTDQAHARYQTVLELARKIPNRVLEGLSLLNMARLFYVMGKMDDARTATEQSLFISRETGERQSEGQNLFNLATLDSEFGLMKEALPRYEQALQIMTEIGDKRSQGIILNNLANLYDHMGNLDQALNLKEQSLSLAREMGDKGSEGIALTTFATLHVKKGLYQKAMSMYEQALNFLKQAGNKRFEGITLGHIGEVYFSQGLYTEAKSYFEQASKNAREIEDPWNECISNCYLTHMLYLGGQLEKASSLYEQIIIKSRKMGNQTAECMALASLAHINLDQGKREESRELLNLNLHITRKASNITGEIYVLLDMAILERRGFGDGEQALNNLKEAETLVQSNQDHISRVIILCERGHLDIMANKSPIANLNRALAAYEKLEVHDSSLVGMALDRLRRAWKMYDSGQHHNLVQGECKDDIPKELRDILKEKDTH